jgi:hypothetical protein
MVVKSSTGQLLIQNVVLFPLLLSTLNFPDFPSSLSTLQNTSIQYPSKHACLSYSLYSTSFFDVDGNTAKNLLGSQFPCQLGSQFPCQLHQKVSMPTEQSVAMPTGQSVAMPTGQSVSMPTASESEIQPR